MEKDPVDSYAELGSEDELLIYHATSDNDSAVSDLSAIKTYSQGDYGDEYLHGYSSQSSTNNEKTTKSALNSPRQPEVPEHIAKLTSEGQRVFLPLSLTSDVKLNWTQRFVQISTSLRQKQPFYAVARDLIKLAALEREFLHTATIYARIIIDEKYLPVEQRTIKPSNLGGVAGGLKYYQEGILFKFSLDNVGLYGGDVNSMKSAGHELKCLGAVFKRLNHKYNVPMMSVIDYKGFRVIAISMLPVGNQTLIYGSNNGGRNFHSYDVDVNDEMNDLGKHLNLQSHQVREDGYRTPLPADIEIHRGLDDRYYIVDVARLWPPEPPSMKGSWLYRVFREEFVTNWGTPLCSDGFSVFLAKDPSARNFSADIRVAFTHYTVVTIPIAAHELSGVSAEGTDFEISSYLHKRGINMRHMGLVWQHLPANSKWRKIVLTEIVTRAAKSALRALMRRALDRFGVHANYKSLNGLICGYFNLLVGSSEDSDLYWAVELKQTVESSFFYISRDEIRLKEVELRSEVDQEVLLQKLTRALGITFKPSFWQSLPIQLMLNRVNVVQSDDIELIEPVVKRSYISRFAEPIEMIERLDCGVKDVAESEIGYKIALQKLMETPSIGHGSNFITFRFICRVLARQNNLPDAKTVLLPYLIKLTQSIWTILESSPMDYQLNMKHFLCDFSGFYFRYLLPIYQKFSRDPEYVSLLQQLVHPYFLGIMLSNDDDLLSGRSVLSEEIFDDITSITLSKQVASWMYQQLFPKLRNLKKLNRGDATIRDELWLEFVKSCGQLETLEGGPLDFRFSRDCEAMFESLPNLRELYGVNFSVSPLTINNLSMRDLTRFSANFQHFNQFAHELCNWLSSKNNLRSLRLDSLTLKDGLVPLFAKSAQQVNELYFGPVCKIEPISDLLQDLKNLTSLSLVKNSFPGQVINITGPFKLKKLTMNVVRESADVLIGILQRSPELVDLRVKSSDLDDKFCEALKSCPNLEIVNLNFNTNITGVGLAHIARLNNIRRLGLAHTLVDDKGIVGLEAVLPQLTDLNLSRCLNITDASVRYILRYGRSLKKLKLSWNGITDQAFEVDQHAASNSLELLAIDETHITDVAMRVIIQKYSYLEVLKLPRSIGIETLKNLYRLQYLRFAFWRRNSFDWATDPMRTGIAAWSLMLNKAGEAKSIVLQLSNARTDSTAIVVVGYAGGAYLYLDNIPQATRKTVLKFFTYNNV